MPNLSAEQNDEALEDQIASITATAKLLPKLFDLLMTIPSAYRPRALKALDILIRDLP